MKSMKDCLAVVKVWLFQYIFVVDTCTVRNKLFGFLMTVAELSVIAYFYYHPNYSIITPLMKNFQDIIQKYVLHIVPFDSSALSILVLSIYPMIMCLVLLLKKIGPVKLLVIFVEIIIYLFPLLAVKILIEMISCIKSNYLPVIAVPLALLSLLFGALILALSGRLHRCLQIPLVIALETGGNQYALMALLGIRLLILLYLFFPHNQYFLVYCAEVSNYIILLSCLFADPQSLNHLSYIVISATALIFGLFLAYISYEHSINIFDKADSLEDDQQKKVFEVLKEIQIHETQCIFSSCKCHQYLEVELKNLKDFAYEYEEERLKRNTSLEGRLEYAQKCSEKYEFKLSGLTRLYEVAPQNILEEYKVFRICQLFESNIRKQEKNYHHGEQYQNVHQEEQNLNQDILAILQMGRDFWRLILNFDGSIKFLNLILKISRAINDLEESYRRLRLKYDQEVPNFKYLYDLFCTLILNQKISDDDQLAVPQPATFIVTRGSKIIGANNNFSILVNRSLETLIDTPYSNYIPEIYRQPHKAWAQNFVGQYEQYEDKSIFKTFAMDNFQIKLVNMRHKILPRFMNGLEIITMIEHPTQRKIKSPNSFLFLVEKDSLFIKHVEPTFYEAVRFKVNQRNIKVLQQMNLNSIFEGLVVFHSSNVIHQTTLIKQFCQQFTYIKKNIKKATKTGERQFTTSISRSRRKSDSGDPIFQYQVLKNQRDDDPYIKVLFQAKTKKKDEQGEHSMSSIQKEQISSEEQARGKEKQFKSNDFRIPYYMVLQLLGVHILFLIIKDNFTNAFTQSKNRFDFYVAYDYTILYSLGVNVGQNMLSKLKELWITGYGDFSESFNAFEHINDPLFFNYFLTEVTITNHNILYQQIESIINHGLQWTDIYNLCLLAFVLGSIAVFVIDFIFSVRYIFKIESQVGDLLLQFVLIDPPDIHNLQIVIDNFIEEVLNHHQYSLKGSDNVPVETVEESALELMRGNSPNVSMMEGEDPVIENRTPNRRRSSNIKEGQKRSLVEIRQEFNESNKRRNSSSLKKNELDSESIREENIVVFKKHYGGCLSILKNNLKLFLLVLIALLISCAVVSLTFVVVYPATSEFRSRVTILKDLYESKVIMLKELIGIAITYSSMQPQDTISENLLTCKEHLPKLSSSIFRNYEKQYEAALTSDVCLIVPNPICLQNSSITMYGLNVMAQHMEEYFRIADQNSIKEVNSQNSLIAYSQAVFSKLIKDYMMAMQQFKDEVGSNELNILIFGTFGLLFSLILTWCTLQEFKNRIRDSKTLLKIIPQEIKEKHWQALEALLSDNSL